MPCKFADICKQPIDDQEPVMTKGNYDPKACESSEDFSGLSCYKKMVARGAVETSSQMQGQYEQDSNPADYAGEVTPIPSIANIHNAKGREKIELTDGRTFKFDKKR